ncbi:MAG: SDR family oxidoreductase [Bacillota bacterium]|mgnify:CR=1 FL=1|jgi:short-subunit dehydrogenase|nr:SDR family oxidoreductase [Bacillota bacterium]HHU43667.1 SDR family oxidoreductase [Clostridiales bacterium]
MQIAIVTGASSGIGKETAHTLIKNGYKVYGLSRTASDKEIEFIKCDLTISDDIKNAVSQIIEKEGRIDLLVNNAGMGISGSIENTTIDKARYIFDVNLFGAFELAKAVIPYMREAGGGRIINISSLAAKVYLPFQGFYSSTKAALNMLFNSLQLEVLPFNIYVTNIMPGDIKTAFTQNRQKNTLEEGVYFERMKRSLAVMERDEQNGMPPQAVANLVLKAAKARRPKLNMVVGTRYRILDFLMKILPESLVKAIIYKIYG